jgi:hypothetical protein
MIGTRVELSNGEWFYVDGSPDQVADFLSLNRHPCPVRLGRRFVNPTQVTQLLFEHDIPSIYTPERLEPHAQ